MLHHIQRSLIEKLGFHPSLRYGQIKPAELDGNVFGYHLKQAIIDGYIMKQPDGSYALTVMGRDFFVRRFDDATKSARTIFLLVIKYGDRFLLRRRKVQPLIGRIGFIHGEPIPELSVEVAAMERLKQKTGLEVYMKVIGTALITQYIGEELASYSHAIILYGESKSGDIIAHDETGENFWSDDLSQEDILPSCLDIVRTLDAKHSWLEVAYTL